tara:strand:+ start:10422 stop:10757 length:336 start_codon:yes stop_codon:yes gene_type:complete
MSQKSNSLCSKICQIFNCKWKKNRQVDIPPKLPADISATLSDVNLNTHEQKHVNTIKDDYKTQYGSTTTEKKIKTEKLNTGNKIRLSIDNDYIRKSSDNLGEVNSPRKPEL